MSMMSAGLCFEFTYKFLLLVQTHFVNIVIDVGGVGREDIWSEQWPYRFFIASYGPVQSIKLRIGNHILHQ